MYHVVGTDGKQYGPVEESAVRAWLRDGRLVAETLSFKAGESQWAALKDRPEFLADTKPMPPLFGAPPREWVAALLLSIFLGYLGVDRFYLGYVGLGLAKLAVTIFTLGILGWVWWLIDLILIATGSMRDKEGRPLVRR